MATTSTSKTFRYVPILRWKQNERIALSHVSGAGKTNVAPLIVLNAQQYAAQKSALKTISKKPSKKAPLSASEVFAKQLGDSWGGADVFLDASDLSGTSTKHALDDIAKGASALGVDFVPSLRLGASTEYQNAVKRVGLSGGRGVALRVSLPEMTSAATWTKTLFCGLGDIDLIIDLAGSVANVAALGVSVATAFAGLHKGGSWRSVTIAGGCIPSTLSSFALGGTPVPREELKLWKMLSGASLPYRIDFGDYGSISPDAPTKSIPAPVPINAKYSLRDAFLVFRGVKIKGPGAIPMDRQLRKYAAAIVVHPKRVALPHCWADASIDRMAADASFSVGNPGVWVGLNVNRHIEITRHTLP